MLFYDNFGYFIARVPIGNLSQMVGLLLYQLAGPVYYYDILAVSGPIGDQIWYEELSFFSKNLKPSASGQNVTTLLPPMAL